MRPVPELREQPSAGGGGAAAGVDDWAGRLLAGDRLALARGITWVENGDPRGAALLRAVYGRTGRAWVVGVTGAPGAGKSTLVMALAARFAAGGRTVGVVAVDPSSPFTGGAVLGDRVRWTRRIEGDVFFRSLASRGQLGGLSRAAFDAIRLMDAAGRDVVLVETVGAGQAEVDVMRAAHTTLVVSVPGLGDEIQATKAGILEIGDIYVVNKADREGADDTARDLRMMLGLSPLAQGRREGLTPARDGEGPLWFPPVVKVSAAHGTGLEELLRHMEDHLVYLKESGRFTQLGQEEDRARMEERLKELAFREALERARRRGALDDVLLRLAAKELDPETAARLVLDASRPEEAET